MYCDMESWGGRLILNYSFTVKEKSSTSNK